jgi:C-terminal processing protease CtpA/Prc
MGNTPPPGLQGENVGFKVVEVKSKSPAERSGLKVETDFIISINGLRLYEMDTDSIVALVKVIV